MAATLEHRFVYPFESHVDTRDGHAALSLAACRADGGPGYFLQGRLRQPRLTALLLRTIADVARSRFYLPPALLARRLALDPVVTSGDGVVRFEAFSSCCGVYGRVDLDCGDGAAIGIREAGRGTTNVDFGAAMVSALARVRDGDDVSLSVGAGEVRLAAPRDTAVEKKVDLPLRWLKGFVEVQACQRRMTLAHEIPARDGRRLLRSLPKTASRDPVWMVRAGRGVRLSRRPAAGGVRLGGAERLHLLDRLPSAAGYRVYGDAVTGACAFEAIFDHARLHLVLSPTVWRGFSGEGQAADDLRAREWRGCLARVRAALRWQGVLRADELAASLREDPEAVRQALSVLGARGLVGYDLAAGAYFHRELPFDLERVEVVQPRLRNARRLVAEARVRILERDGERTVLQVGGSGVEHRVRLTADESRCTCPWFSKHGGERGPCKHVLAARIFLDEEANE